MSIEHRVTEILNQQTEINRDFTKELNTHTDLHKVTKEILTALNARCDQLEKELAEAQLYIAKLSAKVGGVS